MKIKKLTGHSGCQVSLVQRDHFAVVRKMSPSLSYNDRIIRQRNKQQLFKSDLVKKPMVLDSGFDNNLYWFDMEFIKGPTMAKHILLGNQELVYECFKTIINFINNNMYLDESIENLVHDKIATMSLPQEYKFYSDYCLDFDWSRINKSYCHGDLTFENIIKSSDNLYLIDFLDSFCNSKIVDYSKLLQDIILGWSWRKEKRKPFIRLIVMYDYFVSVLSELEIEASKRMLVLNLLRIIPYCGQNSESFRFVEDNLKFIKKEIINE
jgi:hypothetical protein|tara:strand:- start:450 stop:1247 length:798 start_codon:yes stop_codon:yes gene_type:complete